MEKIALITGATAGFGKSSVKKFIENGWKVIAAGRREERLAALRSNTVTHSITSPLTFRTVSKSMWQSIRYRQNLKI